MTSKRGKDTFVMDVDIKDDTATATASVWGDSIKKVQGLLGHVILFAKVLVTVNNMNDAREILINHAAWVAPYDGPRRPYIRPSDLLMLRPDVSFAQDMQGQ